MPRSHATLAQVKGIKPTPIRAVDVVFAAGDTAGPQTLAFCLPNDEDVREAVPSTTVNHRKPP
jgi:hypothetical protein